MAAPKPAAWRVQQVVQKGTVSESGTMGLHFTVASTSAANALKTADWLEQQKTVKSGVIGGGWAQWMRESGASPQQLARAIRTVARRGGKVAWRTEGGGFPWWPRPTAWKDSWQPTRKLAADTLGVPELETEDLLGVEILAAVGPIHGHGSPPEGDRLTVDDLKAFETAARELKDEIRAPLKLGHSKAQRLARASGFVADDEHPGLGWLDNVRVANGKLLADIRAVPKKVASLVRSGAFRTRSIEWNRHTSQATGKTYEHVITGLALLGARAPAVKTLDDIIALYGDETLEDGVRTYDIEITDGGTVDLRVAIIGDDDVVVPRRFLDKRADTGDVPELTLNEESLKALAESLGVAPDDLDETKLLEAADARSKELAEAKRKADEKPEPQSRELSEDDRRKLEAGEKAARDLYEMKRANVVEKAITDGRIEPARKAEFEKLYDADAETTTKLLQELSVDEKLLAQHGSDDDGLSAESRKEQADKQFASVASAFGIAEEDIV